LGIRRLEVDDVPFDLPRGAGRPGVGSDVNVDAGVWFEEPGAGGTAFPAFGDRPRFQVDVLQAVLLHLLQRPFAGPLQVRRTGEAGTQLLPHAPEVRPPPPTPSFL